MNSIDVNGAKYWLPASESDVMTLVESAYKNGEIICMRGSAHSFPIIGELEKQSSSGKPYKFVMLSKMRDVKIDNIKKTVRVEAGCNLGKDPFDPSGVSTEENSLLYQLDQAGLAITDLGGIIHQSVAGFMSMGCSGGSTTYAFDESILEVEVIQFVGGAAIKRTYKRPPDSAPDPDNPFYAIGVSMGLMGVIVAVTFQCVEKFYITGKETITKAKKAAVDLFGDGDSNRLSFEQFLKKTPYTRMFWWPQENVDKVVIWQANQATESQAISYATKAYQEENKKHHPALKPYHEVPYIFGSPIPATVGADALFTAIGQWPKWLHDLFGNGAEYAIIKGVVDKAFYPLILPRLLDIFVGIGPPQKFADIGWKGLPMDNQMNDKLFPVHFTELWISIDQSKDVMNALKDFYDQGPDHTLAFCTEIYAAKSSDFWLSPSYKQEVIRIDVLWFNNDSNGPEQYYQLFWDLLEPFNFKPHWGKYLPSPSGNQGTSYLKGQYKRWDDWMDHRVEVDKENIFLNDYWKDHLGL